MNDSIHSFISLPIYYHYANDRNKGIALSSRDPRTDCFFIRQQAKTYTVQYLYFQINLLELCELLILSKNAQATQSSEHWL